MYLVLVEREGVFEMQALLRLFGGLIIGGGAWAVLGRRIDPENPPLRASALAWVALGLGATSFLMVASGLAAPYLGEALGRTAVTVLAMPAALSIVFAIASLVAAVGAFARHDRHWPTWVGIVVGGLPVLFWVAFVVAEIAFPHG